MKRALLVAFAMLLAGCRGARSALDPAGPQAREIGGLFQVFLVIATVVLALVCAFVLDAVLRRKNGDDHDPEPIVHDDEGDRRLGKNVSVAAVATVVTMLVLLVASIVTGHRLAHFGGPEPLDVTVIGHQWWWEVRYPSADPSRIAVTANEIHVPVGTPVRLRLLSRDVIHSFWSPRLHGKRDLIPGHETALVLQADAPGTYPGQCAEFCGAQHAKMDFLVIAEPRETFDAWLAHQLEAARPPTTEAERHGQEVFLQSSCAMCHTIRGTDAGATRGPDLTHVRDRDGIAAGTLPNAPGHLDAWVVDPQSVKPGTTMPKPTVSPDDFRDLLGYLESLR